MKKYLDDMSLRGIFAKQPPSYQETASFLTVTSQTGDCFTAKVQERRLAMT
jgi:hypothetical protein